MKKELERVLNCPLCYGRGYTGYISEDGDYSLEYCECNPEALIIEDGEIVG